MKRELVGALAWAVIMLALAFGATIAHKAGYIGRDTVTRIAIGIIGLWMAWYGNRIPKTFAPNASARRAQRVAAWSMVLSGLVYAGLWAFAPMSAAIWGGTIVIFGGVIISLAYCLMLQARANAGQL